MPRQLTYDTTLFARAGSRAESYRQVIDDYRHLPVFSDAHAPAPPGRVTVIIPTLNEEAYVEDACRSLAAQTLKRDFPDRVEIMLVDSGSRDGTKALARPHVDRMVEAPRGKLSALNAGVAKAKGDIIVEADADGWFPPSWLSFMVEPLVGADVSAVRGDFRYYDSPLLRVTSVPLRRSLSSLGNFPGGVRAYRKAAFLRTRGFRTRFDQRNFWKVWPEEEFRFRHRLEGQGRLVDAPDAICFKSARRGDPLFVDDPRADRFREKLGEGGTFRDGITDAIYRARRRFERVAMLSSALMLAVPRAEAESAGLDP